MPACRCLQGIRPAQPQDLDAIQGLLKPLEREGIVRQRGRTELLNMLHNFTVVERENQVGAAVCRSTKLSYEMLQHLLLSDGNL